MGVFKLILMCIFNDLRKWLDGAMYSIRLQIKMKKSWIRMYPWPNNIFIFHHSISTLHLQFSLSDRAVCSTGLVVSRNLYAEEGPLSTLRRILLTLYWLNMSIHQIFPSSTSQGKKDFHHPIITGNIDITSEKPS